MAPVPSITGVIKMEVMGNIAGETVWANIFHFGQATAAIPSSVLTGFYGAIESSLNALYTGNMGAAVTVTEVQLTDLTSDTGARISESVDWVGGRIGISAQASACVLASYQIARRYRGGHPRTYFPFGDAALQLNPQSWDETFIANVGTNLVSLINAAAAYSDATEMGCVSYFSGGAERVTPLWEGFTGSEIALGIKSQRRRLTSTSF